MLTGSILGTGSLYGSLSIMSLGGSVQGQSRLTATASVCLLVGNIYAKSSLSATSSTSSYVSYGGKTDQTLKVNIYSPAGTARPDSPLSLIEISGTGLYRAQSSYVQTGDLMSVYVDGAPLVFIGAGEFVNTDTSSISNYLAPIVSILNDIQSSITELAENPSTTYQSSAAGTTTAEDKDTISPSSFRAAGGMVNRLGTTLPNKIGVI
jgi:hypothetical protein